MFLYVKIHFRPVGQIETSYFMIGEDNHKKRGDRLLAMTLLNFISQSLTSLMSDHFFTYTQCQKLSWEYTV